MKIIRGYFDNRSILVKAIFTIRIIRLWNHANSSNHFVVTVLLCFVFVVPFCVVIRTYKHRSTRIFHHRFCHRLALKALVTKLSLLLSQQSWLFSRSNDVCCLSLLFSWFLWCYASRVVRNIILLSIHSIKSIFEIVNASFASCWISFRPSSTRIE